MKTKRLILVLAILSLLCSPIAFAARSLEGKRCSNVGATKSLDSISYLCKKQGKKLTWRKSDITKVEDVNRIFSTDEGYFHNFSHPGDYDPSIPSQWIEFDRAYTGRKNAYRIKRYELGKSIPSTAETPASELLASQQCKIVDGNNDPFIRAFPPAGSHKERKIAFGEYPKPVSTIQVVPIYSSDTAAPTRTPQQDYAKYFDYLKEYIEYASDVPAKVEIRYPEKYLKFSKEIKPYKISHKMNGLHPTFANDIVAEVDSYIDFSGATMAVVVVPSGTALDVIQQGPVGTMRTSEGTLYQTSSVYPDTYDSRIVLEFKNLAHPYWWIHEFFHIGLPLDDHYGENSSNPNSEYGLGWWTLMTPGGGDLSTWEKWILGYISDSQVRCISKDKISTSWIVPTSVKSTKNKMIVVPLSSTKAIIMESIRAAGLYFKHPKETWGVLTYVLDVTKEQHGMGMKLILPTTRNAPKGPFYFAEAPLRNGESVTYEGVKITVVESGNFGDVVKVEKVS